MTRDGTPINPAVAEPATLARPRDRSEHLNSSLPKGTVLKDRYLLTSLIATGGTSNIYKARDLLATIHESDSYGEIVLKVSNQHLHDTDTASGITLHEALTTRNLCHPNIIRVYDYDCDEQYCFVSMEYLNGEPLSQRLARSVGNRLDYRQALEIAVPAADAIHHAHCQGVIHSDIKPGNIIITTEGMIKVIDFGTARPDSGKTALSAQTRETDYSGFTPIYASPETLRDQVATSTDDVFSFACTLYEMLNGQHPFNRVAADIAEQRNISAQRPRKINFWQWQVLKKALSFKQEQRYTSIKRFTTLFRYTRHVWTGILLILALLCTMSYAVLHVADAIQTRIAQDNLLASSTQDQTHALQLIQYLKQQPISKRIQEFNRINKLADLYKNTAYLELRPGIIAEISDEIKHKLLNTGAVPDFPAMNASIDKIKQLYPDSARLVELENLINREQHEYGDALIISYHELWNETRYNPDDVAELLLLRNKMDKLDISVPEPEKHVYSKLVTEMNTAYKKFDFLRINQIDSFRNRLDMNIPEPFRSNLKIDPLQIEAAQALAAYELDKNSQKRDYPSLAAAHFWSPYFSTISKKIKNTWGNKRLYRLKVQMDEYGKRMPYDYPPLSAARKSLAEQFKSKARYYKRKGIKAKEARRLNRTARTLQSPSYGRP